MRIVLTGFLLSILLMIPGILRLGGVRDYEVPDWLKIVVVVLGFGGMLTAFVGLFFVIWQ